MFRNLRFVVFAILLTALAGAQQKPPAKPKKPTEKDRAQQFLRDSMTQGKSYKASDLIEDAAQQGISEDSLHRAKTDLGIVKPDYLKKEKDGWHWRLP